MQKNSDEDKLPMRLYYHIHKVHRIEVEIESLYQDRGRARIGMKIKYRTDEDEIQRLLLERAKRRADARRDPTVVLDEDPAENAVLDAIVAAAANKPRKRGAGSDDDDDDDDDDSEDDDSEDDDDDGGGKKDDAQKAKRRRCMGEIGGGSGTCKETMYISTSELPVFDPFSRLVFTLLPGTSSYPPRLGDLCFKTAVRLFPRKHILASFLRRLHKIAPWAVGNPVRELSVLKDKTRVRGVRDILLGLRSSSMLEQVASTMRNTFRGEAFFSLVGTVAAADMVGWTDERCREELAALTGADAEARLFSCGAVPLTVFLDRMAQNKAFAALALAPGNGDVPAFAAAYAALAEGHAPSGDLAPARGDAFAYAVDLWRRMRTEWGALPWSTEHVADDETRAGVACLLLRGHIALADGHIVPRQVLKCLEGLRLATDPARPESSRVFAAVFGGRMSALPGALATLVGPEAVARGVLMLCPTMQVCISAVATTGWSYVDMERVTAAEIATQMPRGGVVIFVEAHLHALHRVGAVLRTIIACSNRPRVVFAGCTVPMSFGAAHGVPFPFAHVAWSRAAASAAVLVAEPVITDDVLAAAPCSIGAPATTALRPMHRLDERRALGVVRVVEDADELGPAQARDIARTVCMTAAVAGARPALLVFENRRVMDAVMAQDLMQQAFPRDVLSVGHWAVEPDGGHRMIERLWIDGIGGPTSVSTIRLDQAAPEMIRYRLQGDQRDLVRTQAVRPIAPLQHVVVGTARISESPALDCVAVFAQPGAAMRRSALEWLAHIAANRVTLVVANKPNTLVVVNDTAATPNMYDLLARIAPPAPQ